MSFRLGRLVSVLVMAGALLLASCSTTPSSPVASETSTAATKPYGSLVVATTFGAGQIDPQQGSTQQFTVLGNAIFDTLVYYIPGDNKLVGGIAERWEISSDGMSWTFYIRKGVKFHDGSDLTGADVKFSMERMLAPESTNEGSPAWRAAIASVELKDDYTVVFRMKQPQFDFLANHEYSITSVMPKKYIEAKGDEFFGKNPVGSGPWKFVKWEAGNRLELEAVESHWRSVPKFKNVTVVNTPDEATKIAMLKTGELDATMVAPDSLAGLKSAGVRTKSFDGGSQYFIMVLYDVEHPEKYALGDVRVRKALQLSMNAREMADGLFGGNGGPYFLPFVSPQAYFFDSNVLKPDPYDPAQAKKLLAEAGYPNGFNTRLYDVGGGGLQSTVDQAVAGYFRKIGVNAELTPMERTAFQSKLRPKMDPEIWNGVWGYLTKGYVDSAGLDIAFHSTKGAFNNLKNPRLDELLGKIHGTAVPVEKKRLALEAAVMAKNEYSTMVVVGAYSSMGLSAKIGEWTHTGTNGGITPAQSLELATHAK